MTRCPFCGYQFSEQAGEACRGCPLARSCHLIRCPRCGYEMPREPGLVKWLRKWRRYGTRGKG